jgi:hypothetical protein
MTIFHRICLLVLISLLSVSAQAQMRKCVTSSGKSIYTDQPCASKITEKSTEVKDNELLKKVASINSQREIEKMCWVLSHRNSQCYPHVNYELSMVFKENCTLPIKDYEKAQDEEKRKPRNYDRYERYNNSESEQKEADDLLYEHRYTQKSRAVLQCEALEKNMWDFLKQNFSKKISEQDAKIINYKLKISPTHEHKNWREY